MPDSTPTLDPDRIDHLRTFLTVSAATDLAAATRPRHRRRRLAAAALGAVLLGGSLVAVTAVTGGPGPTKPDAAVAIEMTDEWVTVEVLATAQAADAVAELQAAGLDAVLQQPGQGDQTIGGISFKDDPAIVTPPGVASGSVRSFAYTAPSPPELADVNRPLTAEEMARFDAAIEEAGARTLADGRLQFRRGSAITLVVSAWP